LRYIIEINPELAASINKFVQTGKYKSPHDFLIAAVQNQIYVESQDASWSEPSSRTTSPGSSVMSDGMLSQPDVSRIKTVSLSEINRPTLLWGQYNRFLPVKVVTRVAANLLNESGADRIPLTDLQEFSAGSARQLGKELERKDKELGRKRGNIFSAGFPIGRDAEKAVSRFKNQFVGYLAANRVEGAAPALKFLDITNGEKSSVMAGVTDFGLSFASLPNPVIDSTDYSSPLSDEEVQFLLSHIASQIPREAGLIRLILDSVKKGSANPESLNLKLREQFHDWKLNEIIMMRSGIISRISELGLVQRHKNGVKVTYILTDAGQHYLTSLNRSLEIKND
jgi:hypothetical protein